MGHPSVLCWIKGSLLQVSILGHLLGEELSVPVHGDSDDLGSWVNLDCHLLHTILCSQLQGCKEGYLAV